jgi:DNA-binding MarR family transcriptional regulator
MERRDVEHDACRAWQLLMRFFFAERERLPPGADRSGLSPVQCHVLHLIEPGAPVAMRQLARTLSCDASNVTGLVDRLESRGLVCRRPSPEDRRVKVLALTPVGARVRAGLLRRMTRRAHPLSRLSADERKTLVRILEKLLSEGNQINQ